MPNDQQDREREREKVVFLSFFLTFWKNNRELIVPVELLARRSSTAPAQVLESFFLSFYVSLVTLIA